MIIVLSLAIGSFTQQAVKAVPCTLQASNSAVSLPVAYGDPHSVGSHLQKGAYYVNSTAKARAFNALAGAAGERSDLVYGCSTGNCTFPEVAPGVNLYTAGMCGKCVETTPLITEELDPERISVSGYSLSHLFLPTRQKVGPVGDELRTIVTVGTYRNESLSWVGSRIPGLSDNEYPWNVSITSLHILALTNVGCVDTNYTLTGGLLGCDFPRKGNNTSKADWNAVSATCALYPCVQGLHAEVNNNRLIESVVTEAPLESLVGYEDDGMFKYKCLENSTRYNNHDLNFETRPTSTDPRPSECYSRVSTALVRSINDTTDWFGSMVQGNCYLPMRSTYSHADRGSRRLSECYVPPGNNTIDAWWLGGMYGDGKATFDTIAARWKEVAVALTDSWRQATINDYGLNVNTTINGTVWETTICTQFNWPWLLFPAILMVLSVVSLALMMVSRDSSGNPMPVWKSSILPLLYTQPASLSLEPKGYRVNELESSAKEEKLALRQDEELRWRLICATDTKTDSP